MFFTKYISLLVFNSSSLYKARGICKYLNIKYDTIKDDDTNTKLPEISDSNIFYRVVCGSFNNRVYAEERLEELKKLGIEDSFIDIYKK